MGLCFIKGSNGKFQLESYGVKRCPKKNSIRRDQIKPLVFSSLEADSLTICPIWVSGTAEAGACGSWGHRISATLRKPTVYNTSLDLGAIFASELCVTNSHEHVNKDVRRKAVSDPAVERSRCGTGPRESKTGALKSTGATRGDIVWMYKPHVQKVPYMVWNASIL